MRGRLEIGFGLVARLGELVWGEWVHEVWSDEWERFCFYC